MSVRGGVKLAAGLAVVIAACQPPPPAQSPCPPQTVYVAAPPQQPEPSPQVGGGPGPDVGNVAPGTTGRQADIAARLDAEGDQLVAAGRYGEASAKYREAVARDPEPQYFFHLCQSLFHEGRFSEAMTACNAVDKALATADLARKTDALIGQIDREARAQGLRLEPAPPPPPRAPRSASGTQATIAAKLDADGDKLFDAGKFAEASAKYREAVARVPEATYFFHLCRSLHREGKFSEALTACDAANRNDPSSGLRTKIDTELKTIKSDARAQGIDLTRP